MRSVEKLEAGSGMQLTLLPRRHMTRHIPVCPYYMFVPVPVHPYQYQYTHTSTSTPVPVHPYHNIMCDTEFHNKIINCVFLGNSFMSSSECSNNRDLACILGCREVSKVQRTSYKMLCMDMCVCIYVCMYVCMYVYFPVGPIFKAFYVCILYNT